jgi:2,4-dienoyl-CoA reductase-like NADH-dependent reductase (Old Yellow Enzyme family)
MNKINTPLTLPCGAVIPNRLVKAAMTERIADSKNDATLNHATLYRQWAQTGVGLLISGNVMVDRIHLESAGNICLDDSSNKQLLRQMTTAGKSGGGHFWAQISNAGRQTNVFNAPHPKAPSSVKLKKLGLFGTPREMTEQDIKETLQNFIRTAKLAKECGFTGVQIHAAHGYLISQFLSPRTNLRRDEWGGEIENRSRFLVEIIKGCRSVLGDKFPISVKINSADFQRGGFTEDESRKVIRMLDDLGIDLIEISGGTYEKIAFFEGNDQIKESTRSREAYFLEFAKVIKKEVKCPVMLTGGFRTFEVCENALRNEDVDLIGMGRPFITNTHEIGPFLTGKFEALLFEEPGTTFKKLNDAVIGGFYAKQLIRLSKGLETKNNWGVISSSLFLVSYELLKSVKRMLKLR